MLALDLEWFHEPDFRNNDVTRAVQQLELTKGFERTKRGTRLVSAAGNLGNALVVDHDARVRLRIVIDDHLSGAHDRDQPDLLRVQPANVDVRAHASWKIS